MKDSDSEMSFVLFLFERNDFRFILSLSLFFNFKFYKAETRVLAVGKSETQFPQ